jgi:outer membrane protein
LAVQGIAGIEPVKRGTMIIVAIRKQMKGDEQMENRTKTMRLLAAMALWVCLAVTAPAVQAADISLGLGGGLTPDYEGSDDYTGVVLPYASVVWSNYMAVELLANRAKFNLIPSPIWKGGLIGEYIPERDDVDDDKVDKLDDVDTAIMLGGFFGFEYNNWSASVEAMADVADGNDGTIVRLNAGYRIPISDVWRIGLGVFTTWADDDYMESYFGINAVDAANSGLSTYDAEADFKDVGLNLRVTCQPWQHWGFIGLAGYKRMLGDAEDSPVVDDRGDENQFSAGALVFYKF